MSRSPAANAQIELFPSAPGLPAGFAYGEDVITAAEELRYSVTFHCLGDRAGT